nr:hypothetical protein [Tanacetum cinerariifolium]
MDQFCDMKGIKREFSVAMTPQQNGVAERKNKTLIEATRTMALVIKPHNKTPYKVIRGRPPLIDFMKPFGCPVTILNTRDYLGKFDEKADEGFFVGYSVVSKAMRVFNKRSRIVEETLNIRFLEDTPNVKGNRPDWLFDIDSLTISMNYMLVVAGFQTNGSKDSAVDAGKKATEIDESQVSDNGGQDDQVTRNPSWVEAMQDELLQFKLFNVWTLVDLPKDKWAIGTKWVFRNKKDERGIVIKDKVRLVAQRHIQKEDFPNKVYKVEKAIYGLDQAPRACQDKYVADILKKFDFSTIKTASTPMKPNKSLIKDAEAEDRIFRYLKGQPKLGLWYPKDSPLDLEAYSDSDYARASLDMKSTIEYAAAVSCYGQVLWIQNQMLDYGFNLMNTIIYIDNESTICIVKNPVFYSKTKHIEIRHHFIRDSYEKKLIQVIKIHTDHNVIDLLTKDFDQRMGDALWINLQLKLVTKISQSSRPTNLVLDKTVYKEWEDIMEMVATIASSLEAEQDSGNINRTQSMATLNELLPQGLQVKKVNGQEKIQALVDMQKVIITEESIRRDLKFDDADGTACLPNDTIFEELVKMGAKTTAWNEFSSTMASAIICLANNQKFNFSNEILVEESILTPSNDPLPSGEDSIQLNELMIFCTNLQQQVLDLEESKTAQARVKKLEKRRKSRHAGLRRLKKVGSSKQVESSEEKDSLGAQEDASKQGRSIENIYQDAEIALVDEAQGSTVDPVTTAGEVVTIASVEDNAAPTTATTTDVDDELNLAKTLIAIKAAKLKVISTAATTVTTAITTLRAKGIPLKKKDQIALDEDMVRKLEAEMKAKMEEEERIAREKDEANKVVIKNEMMFRLQLMVAEQEQAKIADDDTAKLKRCLEIVPEDDEDVAIKATPLSSKSSTIVDYKIYIEGKKSYFKIIRAGGNSQNYLTFGTMFKNFNREDLEVLRSIVKERFKKTKPVDDIDNLLCQTLKTMFEPHVKDIIWKYQQGANKVNNWKLFDSCGVYYVTTKNMVYYLLVEEMYLLINSILHQLWSDVKLQVDYEVEMAYDLLRLIKRKINEGYKPK